MEPHLRDCARRLGVSEPPVGTGLGYEVNSALALGLALWHSSLYPPLWKVAQVCLCDTYYWLSGF